MPGIATSTQPPVETCRAFDFVEPRDTQALHRFIVGADKQPTKLSAREVKALGDPFATLLLARGTFPNSAEAVIEGIRAAVPKGHALKQRRTFVVGEGSKLPVNAKTANVVRTLRFIVTLGEGPKGPDVFLSVGDPRQSGGVEVMAWKRGAGGFNYYRSTSEPGTRAMWMFAGNSRDALRPKSRAKGPFESHPSGALLMKELKLPWQNWHSPDANIPATVFAKNDRRRTHEWFTEKDPGGAYTFEFEGARPAITRWAARRFATLRKRGGAVPRPRQIMEQVLDTPTVNLVTSFVESRTLKPSVTVDLPSTFFVDADGLGGILGLEVPAGFSVSGKHYQRCLEKFDVHLDDEAGFRPKGDTHFCFLVPERAFEDQEVLREAIEIGLVSKRLAACLLMVDPWNPIFSARRRKLLDHVPATASIKGGKSSFSTDMAGAILKAAETAPAGSAAATFAERWGVGPKFAGPFNKLLSGYYAAVEGKLKEAAGFEAYFQLADERRKEFKEKMPIAEFPLLLPQTNIAPAGRSMRRDGTVATR